MRINKSNFLVFVLVASLLFHCSNRNSHDKNTIDDKKYKPTGIDTLTVDTWRLINENLQNISVVIDDPPIITDSSERVKEKCSNWKLEPEDILDILKLSKEITGSEMHDYYYDLPCKIRGQLLLNGDSLRIIANAGSFIYIYSATHSVYVGCSSEECKKFFLVQGGDAKRDLPRE